MKLIQTTIGELYQSLSPDAVEQLGRYILNNYSSPTNASYRIHQYLAHLQSQGGLAQYTYSDLWKEVFGEKVFNKSLLTTYISSLQKILKEFIILSKIESKNVYTETLWSEYLIEHRLTRNMRVNHAKYRVNYEHEHHFQQEYNYHREDVFISFFENLGDKIEVENKLMVSMNAFENYYLYQKIEDYKSLSTITDWLKRENREENIYILQKLICQAKESNNQLLYIFGLLLSVNNEIDYESYIELKSIFFYRSINISKDLQHTIWMGLLNYISRKQVYKDESLGSEVYELFRECYNRNLLLTQSGQNHIWLGGFIVYELDYGSPARAREILLESIDLVDIQQRDSCRMLCLARIEFAEKNYSQALVFVDQGSTRVSLYYFPLFKTVLLKILVSMENESRVQRERENLYKYLHENKKIDSGHRQRFMLFYKYIDYLRVERYKAMSAYRRRKLKQALDSSAPYFQDKLWMQRRLVELEGEE